MGDSIGHSVFCLGVWYLAKVDQSAILEAESNCPPEGSKHFAETTVDGPVQSRTRQEEALGLYSMHPS
jgi:hypothetical protein